MPQHRISTTLRYGESHRSPGATVRSTAPPQVQPSRTLPPRVFSSPHRGCGTGAVAGASTASCTTANQALGTASDSQLVSWYLNGNSAAFGEIVRRHEPRLYWVARRYGRNDDDARDILQDAFFKAAVMLPTYRHEAALGTWLYRLVANQGCDFRRHRFQRETPVLDTDLARAERHLVLSRPDDSDIDLTLVLRQAMSRLDLNHRIAMVMVDLLGHSVTTVAEQEGVATGTIKSRRARARALLRTALREHTAHR